MSDDLQNFNNLYANLAQGAYPNKPRTFPIESLRPKALQTLNSGQSVKYNFSKDVSTKNGTIPGGQNLPNDGVVYLQPDPTLRSVPRTTDLTLPQMNGGYQSTPHTSVGHYQKGLLTDEEAGFNAYFVAEINEITVRAQGLIFYV